MSEIMIIKNVRGYKDNNGVAQLNLEDVARGLGFTQIKKGIEYIRWETVKNYLKEFSFPTSWENKFATCGENEKLPEYIPENIFYKLCFRAKNEIARKFQDLVTDEILPAIRKHGGYLTESKIEEALLNPDTIIQLATALKNEKIEKEKLMSENKNLIVENEKQNQLIGELKPKADYTDRILRSRGTVKVNVIANDYGFTASAFNKKIKELGIQYKEGKDWLLYKKYREKGYTHTKTFEFKHSDGTPDTKTNMEWTQKGRLFLYEILKQHGILPMIEQEILFN